MAISFKEFRLRYAVTEEKDPCWKGYTQVGMKKKGKRTVPNCVKEDAEDLQELSNKTLRSYRQKADTHSNELLATAKHHQSEVQKAKSAGDRDAAKAHHKAAGKALGKSLRRSAKSGRALAKIVKNHDSE